MADTACPPLCCHARQAPHFALPSLLNCSTNSELIDLLLGVRSRLHARGASGILHRA